MKPPAHVSLAPLKKLRTPDQIQTFLESIPFNFERGGETCRGPASVLARKKAHCLEGAMLAAAALWYQGEKPLLMNLKTVAGDQDHAVALFRRGGYWGAISKTNHAVLRYRDPIYKTLRELALSYFHEYFLNSSGRKTLLAYSTKPFDLSMFGTYWLIDEKDQWKIAFALAGSSHTKLVSAKGRRGLRKASRTEREAGNIVEW